MVFSPLRGKNVYAISCGHLHLYPFEYSVESEADLDTYLDVYASYRSQDPDGFCIASVEYLEQNQVYQQDLPEAADRDPYYCYYDAQYTWMNYDYSATFTIQTDGALAKATSILVLLAYLVYWFYLPRLAFYLWIDGKKAN